MQAGEGDAETYEYMGQDDQAPHDAQVLAPATEQVRNVAPKAAGPGVCPVPTMLPDERRVIWRLSSLQQAQEQPPVAEADADEEGEAVRPEDQAMDEGQDLEPPGDEVCW
jgi:hypothetical protein